MSKGDMGLPSGSVGKETTCSAREMQEMWVQSLAREDPLEKEMATHPVLFFFFHLFLLVGG